MAKRRQKCVVDTNVPKTANLATAPHQIPSDLQECVANCVDVIEEICRGKRQIVIDRDGELFDEYRSELQMSGQPGLGDKFMKWLHDRQYSLPERDRVSITKEGNGYAEFPNHEGLAGFDPSDRKFVAIANAHPEKPPILQATDSKWWGWKDALNDVGLSVHFLCEEYVRQKYEKKIGPNE